MGLRIWSASDSFRLKERLSYLGCWAGDFWTDGGLSEAAAVSASGTVAISYRTDGILWFADAGTLTLPKPAGVREVGPLSFSKDDTVVGYLLMEDLSAHAFIAHGAELRDLTPAGSVSVANAINSFGTVVGSIEDPTYPAIWALDGGVAVLPTPGYTFGGAMAINDQGAIGGFVAPSDAQNYEDAVGAIWLDGGLAWVAPTDAGLRPVILNGVSDTGVFAGTCWLNGARRACRVVPHCE